MKTVGLKELILRLQDVLEHNGDLPVYLYTGNGRTKILSLQLFAVDPGHPRLNPRRVELSCFDRNAVDSFDRLSKDPLRQGMCCFVDHEWKACS